MSVTLILFPYNQTRPDYVIFTQRIARLAGEAPITIEWDEFSPSRFMAYARSNTTYFWADAHKLRPAQIVSLEPIMRSSDKDLYLVFQPDKFDLDRWRNHIATGLVMLDSDPQNLWLVQDGSGIIRGHKIKDLTENRRVLANGWMVQPTDGRYLNILTEDGILFDERFPGKVLPIPNANLMDRKAIISIALKAFRGYPSMLFYGDESIQFFRHLNAVSPRMHKRIED